VREPVLRAPAFRTDISQVVGEWHKTEPGAVLAQARHSWDHTNKELIFGVSPRSGPPMLEGPSTECLVPCPAH